MEILLTSKTYRLHFPYQIRLIFLKKEKKIKNVIRIQQNI